ncbi:sugar ABC transporter ATP-binding protein [Frankia sp. CNm7]|uniref:Sugar ABC transporter ATP-binding protein n=2 Tax=Frankia nepalensis TaxID=1836974 RepID=A0A937RF30_9ACTN|nr:sugar ABC transporter ATP-binding protein [Frankia nepalensis]MBL7509630.1 sugar ABC transporter ATP-binding protein [Frankia nepalensis]MBL7517116.1 sugar ABC transporter ATP-binding protein [Frankia nepalensis]MBL7631011.1 sugar ABC transporter ATP-binding protein [Frankia nepalensis]
MAAPDGPTGSASAAGPVLAPASVLAEVAAPRLRVENVSKTFGRHRALREVGLDLLPGEIHALVGQNGCGKSTLAKVLTGYHAPDPGGRVLVDGSPLRLPVRPLEARAAGVAVVHQSLGLVNEATVVENLRVGRFQAGRLSRRIRWGHERAEASALLERLGRSLPLHVPVGTLAEEARAAVAIARALQDASPGRGLIIFDESTRSLGREALEQFYEILDEVVGTGTAVLLISHRLEEVVEAADRVTVLRDGVVVESGLLTAGLRETDLARLVLGRALAGSTRSPAAALAGPASAARSEAAPSVVARGPGPHASPGAPEGQRAAGPARAAAGEGLIELAGVTGAVATDLSLRLARGEIVGITGLAGSGYDELPYLVTGARRARAGLLSIDGATLALAELDSRAAIAARVVLVPEAREHAGLALDQTIAENVLLPRTGRQRRGLAPVRRDRERSFVKHWINAVDVRPPAPEMTVGKLSGGNQQKVLMAKWLAARPRLLALHEPTQAVDVGARATITAAIRAAAGQGCAVLVAGTDENELALLCDRVLVVQEGRLAAELGGGGVTPEAIVAATYAGGARRLLRPSAARGTTPAAPPDARPDPPEQPGSPQPPAGVSD